MTQRIVIRSAVQAIDVVEAGQAVGVIVQAGPVGPPGPGGSGDGSDLTFTQSTPSDDWVINHNFGFYPNVDLYTVGGISMLGQVLNTSTNQTHVLFSTPVAGTARLT